MKCEICNGESDRGSLIFGLGFVCSEDCAQIAKGRIDAHHKELSDEPLAEMPDKLETADFERWALKLAIHALKGLTAATESKLRKNNPMMLVPHNMALELKDQIIRHIPRCYVSETEAKGHDRMFYGGTYCFRQPVPKEVIYAACKKAEILQ